MMPLINRPSEVANSPLKKNIALALPAVKEAGLSMGSANGGRHRWLQALLWVIFGVGLGVQFYGPSLKIEKKTFVIPQALMAEGKNILPAKIIADERRKQLLSAILTVSGALGLGCYYRATLVGSLRSLTRSRPRGTVSLLLKTPSRIPNKKQQNRKPYNETI
jgi:hypothetical protein